MNAVIVTYFREFLFLSDRRTFPHLYILKTDYQGKIPQFESNISLESALKVSVESGYEKVSVLDEHIALADFFAWMLESRKL